MMPALASGVSTYHGGLRRPVGAGAGRAPAAGGHRPGGVRRCRPRGEPDPLRPVRHRPAGHGLSPPAEAGLRRPAGQRASSAVNRWTWRCPPRGAYGGDIPAEPAAEAHQPPSRSRSSPAGDGANLPATDHHRPSANRS